ncbi:MAG: hypothetical protein BHW55_09255 [Candidatus Melainabacteria bacterium 35_41]|nr:MAG: hypothetical protein BHW55_09255 [Candidatus Melainabacteria bacterium 35_41]
MKLARNNAEDISIRNPIDKINIYLSFLIAFQNLWKKSFTFGIHKGLFFLFHINIEPLRNITLSIKTPTGEMALSNDKISIVKTTFANAVNNIYMNPSNDFLSAIIEVIK